MSSKDAEKKQRELARLEQLKQAMRSETENGRASQTDVETRKTTFNKSLKSSTVQGKN